MTIVRVRRAIEEGRLDPVAREVAVSIAKGTLWQDFFGGSIWGFIGEFIRDEVSPERAAKMHARLLAYQGVCQELNLEVEYATAIGLALDMTEPEGGDDETEH